MRSTARIKSHPIHPILVAFPIAFFTGTLAFDLLSLLFSNGALRTVGYYMEITGVIGALAAAVAGVIDYVYTIPPESSARKRGLQHGLVNVTHTALFFVAWLLRRNADVSFGVIIGMEVVGVGLMLVAGWMGGTLVHRNQIGVDHRYANAGKWKEERLGGNDNSSDKPIQVATASELKTDQMKLIHVNGKRIVIGKTEHGYVAFDDRCTHRGASLADGAMICGTVQCPWHGSQFDAASGEVKAGPAKKKIEVYALSEKNGKVYLTL